MKKVIKYIIIIFLIFLIIFIINIIRKYIIINKIENKLSKMDKISNYYLKITDETSKINDSNFSIYSRLNDMKMSETNFSLIVMFPEDATYTLDKGTKTYLKSQMSILEDIDEYYPLTKYFSNWTKNEQDTFEQIKLALKSKIKKTDYKGKKCYAIYIKDKDNNLSILYIDKETLLLSAKEVVQDNKTWTTLYEAKFNTLTEKDFSKDKILEGYNSVSTEELDN